MITAIESNNCILGHEDIYEMAGNDSLSIAEKQCLP